MMDQETKSALIELAVMMLGSFIWVFVISLPVTLAIGIAYWMFR